MGLSLNTSGARWLGRMLLVSAAVVGPCAESNAVAYSYASLVSDGCHERATTLALRDVRSEPVAGPLAAPMKPSSQERALIDDLPFILAEDVSDLAGATLLIGVRDNDLKGHDGLDSMDLASIHGASETQPEHCLREPQHDEPSGTQHATAACRAFIRSMVLHAIENGLDAEGRPDRSKTTIVPVHLSIAGRVSAELPIFYFYMGRALHALQDSFSHNFRKDGDDGGSVVTVSLNFVDVVSGRHEERRDGPPHMLALDQCEDVDEFRRRRFEQVRVASRELLRAAIAPGETQERNARVDAVLDKFLSHRDGCTYDNHWCDAPENRYRDPAGCSCGVPTAPPGGVVFLLLLLGATGLARRNLIGLEFFLGGPWRLVIDPADVAFAMPHISGVPLIYRQYRFTVGLQFGASCRVSIEPPHGRLRARLASMQLLDAPIAMPCSPVGR